MRRIRYLALAALAAFVALPVARVYTAGAPWIEKIEIRNNDLAALQGRGVPGTQIGIYYRQRNFRQGGDPDGYCPCLPRELCCHDFAWCDWLNGGNALYLGSAVVGGAGTWRLQGRDKQVLPGEAGGLTCASGVLTQIELNSQYGDVSVPDLEYFFTTPNTWSINFGLWYGLVGAVQGANQAAIGVADGPNDVQGTTTPWTVDTDQDGIDTCASSMGCGARVNWTSFVWYYDPPSINLEPPTIDVRDDSTLTGPRDQEFGHVMGMLQGHKPGGSVLAAAYVPRPMPLGPAFDVNVDMNGASVAGAGCDAAGGYFEFFP